MCVWLQMVVEILLSISCISFTQGAVYGVKHTQLVHVVTALPGSTYLTYPYRMHPLVVAPTHTYSSTQSHPPNNGQSEGLMPYYISVYVT